MRVYVLIPVFNRLQHTRRVLECLRAQTCVGNMRIVVINDGSTDGTLEFLDSQSDVATLHGDGSLWWAGSIDLGLRYVLANACTSDYVLFLNNDTWFLPEYLEILLRVSCEFGGAAVGSVIHEEQREDPLVSVGPRININRIAVWDLLSELHAEERRSPEPVYRVDALSGRGTLYPVSLFKDYGGMLPRLLPHYLADYEVSMRFARDANTCLLVSSQAIVFSPPVYGNSVEGFGFLERLFGQRSSSNIIRLLVFYCMVGSPIQRLTAPLRLAYFGVSRFFIQIFKLFLIRT